MFIIHDSTKLLLKSKSLKSKTMTDYFHEMNWQPLGEGQQPDHLLHLARLLRDYNMFEELGENSRIAPPASKEAVTNLPFVDVAEGA